MKKSFRYILYLCTILLVMILCVVIYLTMFLPNVGPPPDIQVEMSPENIERGNYLANHVMLCMDCHAERDFTLYAGPPRPGTLGTGGEVFDQSIGLPGRFVSPNLTPFALGEWTDGEIYRAVTSGVSRDGRALFPIMPYPNYSQLDDEDIYAVIAYLRSLEPVEKEIEPSKADFPVSLLMNTMPVKPSPQKRPDPDDIIPYGRYLITAAACSDCHTRMERGAFVGEPYAGGNEYLLPGGAIVRSVNITPHETGIGLWSKEQFISRFKAHADTLFTPHLVEPGKFQTIMPWQMYAGMSEDDLAAIYAYLMSLPAVENKVEVFTPPGQ